MPFHYLKSKISPDDLHNWTQCKFCKRWMPNSKWLFNRECICRNKILTSDPFWKVAHMKLIYVVSRSNGNPISVHSTASKAKDALEKYNKLHKDKGYVTIIEKEPSKITKKSL